MHAVEIVSPYHVQRAALRSAVISWPALRLLLHSVHDLRHMFGMRLRSARASFAGRQVQLGHESDRTTYHYSRAELDNLVEAANAVCDQDARKTHALVLLKRKPRLVEVCN